jgi:hypothetical protein
MCLELNQKWNLSSELAWNKNKAIIKIGYEDYDKIMELINPFIINPMRYKLPLSAR